MDRRLALRSCLFGALGDETETVQDPPLIEVARVLIFQFDAGLLENGYFFSG